ncbi:hypothetical protein D9758_011969 [Tetrapyrgos nigripes]|uniref:Carboxylic ester hydrolase n=1 Tax=Tetrapyrgos nigripes TaxID=182062 RepID=A0A8H5D293_9AGAR|nr:hypothetical protein D9758_011969 [Tetrapyrgos nigripes]
MEVKGQLEDAMPHLLPCLLSLLSASSVVLGVPEVKIGSTTVIGKNIPSLQQEFFGGIPFAEPPVGPLRLKPPVFKDTYDQKILNVTQFGFPCVQQDLGLDQSSEDCLTLNIYRPAGISSHVSLPVFFWTYGGGFYLGTGEIDASALVARSMQRGTPIVYVSFNYRLGPLGWPQGKEAEEKGALNLGLKDELAALEWVHKHIGKFGGDPSKVTVGGSSAGAIMTAILFMHPSTERLVRAGIFQSGSAGSAQVHNASFRQDNWDKFVGSVPACANRSGTDNSFDCLRHANITDIVQGVNGARAKIIEFSPWDPVLDGALFPAAPSVMRKLGRFARIPFIAGTNLDEGPVFIDPTPNYTSDQIRANLVANLSTPLLETTEKQKFDDINNKMLELYPEDPALGSPFGTGNDTFGVSPGFKRIAAMTGDMGFTSQRRTWQQTMANNPFSGVKSYGYLWKTATVLDAPPFAGPRFGVRHGSDTEYLYNNSLVDTVTPGALEAGVTLVDYYLSFIDSLDPNDGKGVQRPKWSVYSKHEQMVMQMEAQNFTQIPDTFRKEQIDFINSLPDVFHH